MTVIASHLLQCAPSRAGVIICLVCRRGQPAALGEVTAEESKEVGKRKEEKKRERERERERKRKRRRGRGSSASRCGCVTPPAPEPTPNGSRA